MKNNYIFCNNCGKSGHLFQQCKQPITSIGIITINPANNNFLLRSRMRRELCLMQKGYSMVTLDALLCSV